MRPRELRELGRQAGQAVGLLVETAALREGWVPDPGTVRLAAVRVIMRLVVVCFAESRNLLPMRNEVYAGSYSLGDLHRRLSSQMCRDPASLSGRRFGWSRLQALFALVHDGSLHPGCPMRAYGGDLFLRGVRNSSEALAATLSLFDEPGCGPDDRVLLRVLDLLCRCPALGCGGRGQERGKGGRVDFARLPPEYIGTLYENLLDSRGLPPSIYPVRPPPPPGEGPGACPTKPEGRSRLGDAASPRPPDRKRSGIFYTPQALAHTTVRRTLAPLCRRPGGDKAPRAPDEILALKVCDPAMGSGAFLVAALRCLTRAVMDGLSHHGRLRPCDGGSTIVRLVEGVEFQLPSRPGDPVFDSLLEAHVRRHVVENCLYGVDLDPLAVELARVSLWLETMDQRLPFTFLAHKLVAGNSLVGAWARDLDVYPFAALSRNGKCETLAARQLAAMRADRASPLLPFPGAKRRTAAAQNRLAAVMQEIHRLPVQLPDRKKLLFEKEFQSSRARREAQRTLDGWCALWFWPPGRAESLPLPDALFAPGEEPLREEIVASTADQVRFFHWELAFPDVFVRTPSGFDAVVGNPPWDVAKPCFKEFAASLGWAQGSQPSAAAAVEAAWSRHKEHQRALSHWFLQVGRAGGRFHETKSSGTGRRREPRGEELLDRPFIHQGAADLNSYKLFLEQACFLCRDGGRLGLILPSGLYSDEGARGLRNLLFARFRWEWLFGFENRRSIFPIDQRTRFAAMIAEKGGSTTTVRASFMHATLEEWERAGDDEPAIAVVAGAEVEGAENPFVEVTDPQQAELLRRIRAAADVTAWEPASRWSLRYGREHDAGNARALFRPVRTWESEGWRADGLWTWGRGPGPLPPGGRLLPVYQGVMIGQFDFAAKGHRASPGGGETMEQALAERAGCWAALDWPKRGLEPRFLMPAREHALVASRARTDSDRRPAYKVVVRRITNATNARTVIAALIPDLPCTDKLAVLRPADPVRGLALVSLLNSFAVDFVARLICAAANLDRHHLVRLPLPADLPAEMLDFLALGAIRLNGASELMAPLWMEMAERLPLLRTRPWKAWWAVTPHERSRVRAALEAVVGRAYGLGAEDLALLLSDCALDTQALQGPEGLRHLNPRGFWRVDRHLPPALRLTTLAVRAAEELEAAGLEAFLEREWELPERSELEGQAGPCRELAGPKLLPFQEDGDAAASWAECASLARRIREETALPADLRGRLPLLSFRASGRQAGSA